MTVSCETRRFTYACDGETRKWPVEFNYIDGGTVKVFLISAGGDESEVKNITVSCGYVTAPATGEPFAVGNSVRVERILPFTQLDDYTAQGNFTPENMERTADNMVMLAQQIRDVADDTDGYVSDNLGKIEEYKDAAAASAEAAASSASAAESAKESASSSAASALDAKEDAVSAKQDAETAKTAAETAAANAGTSEDNAEAAADAAAGSALAAQNAKNGAESAKSAAESAQAAAETAKGQAQTSASNAADAATSAAGSARAAANSAAQAAQSAGSMTPYTSVPLPAADTGSAGMSAQYARGDHVHPLNPKIPLLDDDGKISSDALRIVGALAEGAIIEQGSNANGEYVRFANGLQICQSEFELPVLNSIEGTAIWHSGQYVPPATFLGQYQIFFSGASAYNGTATPIYVSTSYSQNRLYIWNTGKTSQIINSGDAVRGGSGTSYNITSAIIRVTAIGRWKA